MNLKYSSMEYKKYLFPESRFGRGGMGTADARYPEEKLYYIGIDLFFNYPYGRIIHYM